MIFNTVPVGSCRLRYRICQSGSSLSALKAKRRVLSFEVPANSPLLIALVTKQPDPFLKPVVLSLRWVRWFDIRPIDSSLCRQAWLHAWDVLTCLRAHEELPKLETLHALMHLQPKAAQHVLWRFTKYYEDCEIGVGHGRTRFLMIPVRGSS